MAVKAYCGGVLCTANVRKETEQCKYRYIITINDETLTSMSGQQDITCKRN